METKTVTEAISRNIVFAIADTRYSIKQVVMATRVSRSQILGIEPFNLVDVRRIADFLHVDFEKLIMGVK